jgi:hypothetical protein
MNRKENELALIKWDETGIDYRSLKQQQDWKLTDMAGFTQYGTSRTH